MTFEGKNIELYNKCLPILKLSMCCCRRMIEALPSDEFWKLSASISKIMKNIVNKSVAKVYCILDLVWNYGLHKNNFIGSPKMQIFRNPLTGLNTLLIVCRSVALWGRCTITNVTNTCMQYTIYFYKKNNSSMLNAYTFSTDNWHEYTCRMDILSILKLISQAIARWTITY